MITSNPARDELAKFDQWVNWRTINAKPKPRKIPVDAKTGKAGRSNDPATWAALETALARDAARIGYVFAESDPFGGVDLDCCRDPETGIIHPNAWRIIRAFNTYTEISPSKTGVKLWCRFQLPDGTHNEKNYDWDADAPAEKIKGSGQPQAEIAIFDRLRYFTFTGDHLEGTPWSINDCQGEVEKLIARLWPEPPKPEKRAPASEETREYSDAGDGPLSDDEVLRLARRAKNGVAFDALYTGNIGGYPSHSEADFALLVQLAFWTARHPAQMDRMFRDSGLWTPEREKQKGKNYIRDSVTRACERQTDVYERKGRKKRKGRPETASSNGAAGGGSLPPTDPLAQLNLMGFELRFLGAKWRGSLIIVDTDHGRIVFQTIEELTDWRKARNTICEQTQVLLVVDELTNVGAVWDRTASLIVQLARLDCRLFESPIAEEVNDIVMLMWQRSGCKEAYTHEDIVEFIRQCERIRGIGDDPPPCIFRYKERMVLILSVLRSWASMPTFYGRDLPLPQWRSGLHAIGFERKHNPMTVAAAGRKTNVRVWIGSPKRFVRMVETID